MLLRAASESAFIGFFEQIGFLPWRLVENPGLWFQGRLVLARGSRAEWAEGGSCWSGWGWRYWSSWRLLALASSIWCLKKFECRWNFSSEGTKTKQSGETEGMVCMCPCSRPLLEACLLFFSSSSPPPKPVKCEGVGDCFLLTFSSRQGHL